MLRPLTVFREAWPISTNFEIPIQYPICLIGYSAIDHLVLVSLYGHELNRVWEGPGFVRLPTCPFAQREWSELGVH